MRVLFDEQIPVDFALHLTGHVVRTVRDCGWTGLTNGALLDQAAGLFDAFVTLDRKLERQQRLEGRRFGVVLLRARSTRMQDLLPLVPALLAALEDLAPGTVRHVGV